MKPMRRQVGRVRRSRAVTDVTGTYVISRLNGPACWYPCQSFACVFTNADVQVAPGVTHAP
jgi:hypothetical protein